MNQALDNAKRDYDKAYDSYGSRCLQDQEPSLPHEESPPDVNKLQTTAPLNHTGTLPDTDVDTGEFNNTDLQHAPDDALQTLPGTAPELSPALPEHDIRTFLQPLPPGWVQGQGFSVGLHPTTDVFELANDTPRPPTHEERGDASLASGDNPRNVTDTDQDNETSQREACDKGGETSPGFHKGKTPHARRAVKNALTQQWTDMTTTAQVQPRGTRLSTTTMRLWTLKIHNIKEAFQNLGVSPKLTVQQRTRLHQLLRSGDLRALRKRKRAEGSWDKDNHRGWNPSSSTRERSPLPRRRPSRRETSE